MSSTLAHCPIATSPFDMMVDPMALQRALEGSQRLESLNRRICRPLDRHMPGRSDEVEHERSSRSHND